MGINVECLKVDQECVIGALRQASEGLESAGGELALDFSAVRRIGSGELSALEELAGLADAKAVKVVLKGVNIDIYKVLTLVRLVPRFSFVN
jgi:ABC-type transporter Mla MlaB component